MKVKTIVSIRKALELTVAQFCKKLGISTPAYYGWTTGRTNVSAKNIKKIEKLHAKAKAKWSK